MNPENLSQTDLKARWGGFLEFPIVSKIHRRCLDGGLSEGIAKIINPLKFDSLLDVGCGLGECAVLKRKMYVGLDNSFNHIHYASLARSSCLFIHGDAYRLPFKTETFDASLLACAAHHFSNDGVCRVVTEMKRVSRRYLIIDDAIKTPDQSRASWYLYSLDRGTMFRTFEELENLLESIPGMNIVHSALYKTFPGFYTHVIFILEVSDLD